VRIWNIVSRTGTWLAGSFIFIETATFRELGGFSEDLFAGEEVDLSRRVKKMARHKGSTVLILHRHPLMTSARKLRLYTPKDHVMLLVRFALGRGTLRDRKDCAIWYDGKR
jgi:hypothetical protein